MRLAIMGAIGSGKTTLGKHITENYDYSLVSEPTGHEFMGDLLHFFYKNKEKYAFLAQFRAFSNIYMEMVKANSLSNVIFDSTLFTNRIFVEQIYQSLINAKNENKSIVNSKKAFALHSQLEQLRESFRALLPDIKAIDKYILLNCDASWCLNNVHARDRGFEQGQDKYLQDHHSSFYSTAKELFTLYEIPQESIVEVFIDHDPHYHFLDKLSLTKRSE